MWFREENPTGSIVTRMESHGALTLIVHATVISGEDRIIATGMATVRAGAGTKWEGREVEKAETAAIGRALSVAGYGAQFIDDVQRRPEQNRNGRESTVPEFNPVAYWGNKENRQRLYIWASTEFQFSKEDINGILGVDVLEHCTLTREEVFTAIKAADEFSHEQPEEEMPF